MTPFKKGIILALCLLSVSFKHAAAQSKDFDLLTQKAYVSATSFTSRTLPANKEVHCVSYYARLDGKDYGTLQASLVEADTGKTIDGFDHISHVDEGEASLTYFDIDKQSKPFKVVIKKMEGVTSDSIEILDVEVKEGTCLEADLSCTFEKNTCSVKIIGKRWRWTKPSYRGGQDMQGYPAIDVNTNSENGHYMSTRVTNQQPEAQFILPIMNTKRACIVFYYTIYGAGKLVVGKRDSDKIYDTFINLDPTSQVTHPKWRVGRVNVREDEDFQVTFTAYVPGSGEDSKMAVDDVQVTRHECSYHPLAPPPKEIPIIKEASCTFEDNCSDAWTPLKTSKGWSFKLLQGKGRPYQPFHDHTRGNGLGNFMYRYVWPKPKNTQIVLRGPDFDRRHDQTGPNCFSFWYYMVGRKVPRLSAFFKRKDDSDQSHSQQDALWTRSGDQGLGWQQAFVHTPYPGQNNKAHIDFVIFNTVEGRVAIDDVIVYDGPCPNIGTVCDFENLEDMCGLESGEWKRGQAKDLESVTGLATDRSTNTKFGYYIYIYINDGAQKGSGALLKSHMYPATAGRCLKFYYSVENRAASPFVMDISIESESGDRFLIDELSGAGRERKWSLAEINVLFTTNFQIVFSARGERGVISLDDIQLSNAACRDSYGCDFEQGTCAWSTSLDDPSNLDWQVTSGHLVKDHMVPDKDVTLNTPFGQYIYLETGNPPVPGEMAVLTSQELAYGSCLTFYYSMMNSSVGTLMVNVTNLADGSAPETIWSKSGSQGESPQWNRAGVDINVTPIGSGQLRNFQLSLIGTSGSSPGADIAVDEIKIHYERCSNVQDNEDLMVHCPKSKRDQQIKRSQLCNFIVDCDDGEDEENCEGCDFDGDNGWCNLVDLSQGDIVWASSAGATAQQLQGIPTSHGTYIYLERSTGQNPGPQILAGLETSLPMGPSPPSCQLQFSYFISDSDSDVPPLTVVLRQSDEETVLFQEQSLVQGTRWRPAYMEPVWTTVQVDIGGIDSRFKIAFLGHKRFGLETEGQVAIDDIKFKNCQFPPVEDTCLDSQFRCSRGSCVDMSRVCDFTDDCGDQSDETDCESQGVILRTSFEDGFGDWVLESDESSSSWAIVQAKDGAGLPARPSRDHTLGALNGHFASTSQRTGESPPNIVSPVLIPANDIDKCHLRLNYYLHATDQFTHLRVSTRTTQLGEEKAIFHRYTSHGTAWTRADIEIENTGEPFQIVISGESEIWRGRNYVAIDDISLSGCNISSVELPLGSTVAPVEKCQNRYMHRCDDGTCIPLGQLRKCDFINQCPDGSDEKDCGTCDFETGLCGWHDESRGTISWVSRGSAQEREPSHDSTKDMEGEGHYLLLKPNSAGVDKTPALLMSPILMETDPSCQLSFYYYTSQSHSDTKLKVVTQNVNTAGSESYMNVHLIKDVDLVSGQWNRVVAKLGMTTGRRRVIIKHDYLELNDDAAIAIDDIKFENCERYSGIRNIGDAEDPLACIFDGATDEAPFCQYHPSYMEGIYHWSKGFVSGVNGKPLQAAMAGAWTGSEVGHTAVFTSDWINGTDTGLCIHFMYMTFGTGLEVSLLINQGQFRGYIQTKFTHHSYDYTWKMGQASIPKIDRPFLIQFVSSIRSHAKAVYIASISVSDQECFPSALCDFFNDDCGYTSYNAWSRQSPRIAELLDDHTSGQRIGKYMVAMQRGSPVTETLTSPVKTQAADQGSCTYFWYSIRGQDPGSLTVKLKHEGSNIVSQLWQAEGQQANYWLQGRVDIPKDAGEYRLMFEAALNGYEMITLDDIETILGACPNPGTCNFDKDMCGYTSHTFDSDNSEVESEARWIRLVSVTPMSSHGPQKDHTQMQHNGGYAFSDQFIRLFLNSEQMTRLVSPVLPPTKEACFFFWYFFNGRGNGILMVKVADDIVLNITSKGDEWRHSSPIQHSSDVPYQITFESVRTSHEEAALAVDDIVVTQGPCTERHNTPLIPPKPTATTTQKPRVPVKKPDPGTGSAADQGMLGCIQHCVHWKSCRFSRTNSVECECDTGYTGEKCDEVAKIVEDVRPVVKPQAPKPSQKRVNPYREDLVAAVTAHEGGNSSSSSMQVVIAVIVTIVVIAILALVGFVVLVKTNRLRAPASIQRMVPYLKTGEGFENPNNTSATEGDWEVSISNPVYGSHMEESGI